MALNKILKYIFVIAVFPFSFFSCGVEVPHPVAECDSVQVDIYPDYKNVSIPCNIAPLNFVVNKPGSDCRVCVTAPSGERIVVEADGDGEVRFPMNEWKKLLSDNSDTTLKVDLYVKESQWSHLKPFYWRVVPDSIDPFLTCRLIEPSYRGHGVLEIVSFDMEHNKQRAVASNKEIRPEPFPVEGTCCLNCHAQQKNGSGNSSFCYRGANGGLVITYKGETKIANTKVGDMYASTMYETWHPSLPFIAFSINAVGQSYPFVDPSKTEVVDDRSDLVLYDIEKDEVSYIQKTKNRMETFPCWSNDGKMLYYASTDSALTHISRYGSLRYDIYRISFDADSMKWGEPERIVNMSSMGYSANYPQPSPDGKCLLFCVSRYGSSPYRHADCDVYKLDFSTNVISRVVEVNDPYESDYCREWSSNGRWILISSRREDGNYARPFFSYYDSTGQFSKPFQIPHENPSYDRFLLKSYNAPKFAVVDPALTTSDFYELVKNVPTTSKFNGVVDSSSVDGTSGASVIR